EILSNVDGCTVQTFDAKITRILEDDGSSKNFMIEITDDDLLDQTGGIVQGMSGSPIIQDGKLVGAVTHVLVNDPTSGYGIFIESMLDAAG
ncbi:MAG: SpoIVB peptidase, partial [Pygmaiobacter massiliensis]|nr:SpoIVB peptidase [Pygmaiobacter massiliensis]